MQKFQEKGSGAIIITYGRNKSGYPKTFWEERTEI